MFNTISRYWARIQGSLLPELEEQLGPLTEKQVYLVSILDMVRVERFVRCSRGNVGRPPKSRTALARAFVAKMVLNIPTTRMLLERVQSDTSLRRICGWQSRGELPDESVFSRSFAEFATSKLPEQAHCALVTSLYKGRLVGHVSRDSTAIKAREKPMRKKKSQSPSQCGHHKKGQVRQKEVTRLEKQLSMTQEERLADLPTSCDIGAKTNSKGNKEYWIGYKCHIDTADGDIPLSCLVTSASLHDSQAAIPLAEITAARVRSLYDLMDAAYDSPHIIEHSRNLGHVPIIDKNARRDAAMKAELEMEARAQKTLNMHSPEQIRYNQRSSAERVNSRLKDEFGGRMVRVRGHVKVGCHLMFGLLALTADAILNLIR